MVTHMLLLARQNKISSVHCYSAAPYRNIKVLILSPQWTKFTALFHYLLTLQCLNHSTQKLPSFLFKHDKTTCVPAVQGTASQNGQTKQQTPLRQLDAIPVKAFCQLWNILQDASENPVSRNISYACTASAMASNISSACVSLLQK